MSGRSVADRGGVPVVLACGRRGYSGSSSHHASHEWLATPREYNRINNGNNAASPLNNSNCQLRGPVAE